MKKYVYYLSPFLLIPIILTTIEYFILNFALTDSNVDKVSTLMRISIIILLLLLCIIFGSISPSTKKFDCIMTVIIPSALCIYLLIAGFINKGSDVMFDIVHGFRVAFKPFYIMLYPIMAAITFVSSFKTIRITQIIKLHKK